MSTLPQLDVFIYSVLKIDINLSPLEPFAFSSRRSGFENFKLVLYSPNIAQLD